MHLRSEHYIKIENVETKEDLRRKNLKFSSSRRLIRILKKIATKKLRFIYCMGENVCGELS